MAEPVSRHYSCASESADSPIWHNALKTMLEWLRDIALSFCPAWVRKRYRSHSPTTVLRASIVAGILQAILCSWWLFLGYRAFWFMRSQQYGPILRRANETTQAWFGGIFWIEYILFHPLALLLLYLVFEGLVRFGGGLCTQEVIPSLPVTLAFAIKATITKRQERGDLDRLASVPDEVEMLDGDRFRVASARPRPNWNANMTIEIRGECYEVEREEKGAPPRIHVYFLRRAPIGKIRRGYEQYSIPATLQKN